MIKFYKLILHIGKLAILSFVLSGLSFAQTGTITVTSIPSGAPFNIVSSDSSYDTTAVTYYEDDNAPAELQFTVTWYTFPEYTAPASTTAFLNAGGEVDFSGTYTISTPNAPSNLIGYTISSDQIQLFWTDNSNVATAYIVQQNGFDIATIASNATTYLDTSLTPGTQYCYTVRANDSTGDSGLSNQFCLYAGYPNPPSNLVGIAISNTQVDLSWQDNSNGQDGFILQRMDTTLSEFSTINTLGENETTYVDQNLTQNSIYTYQVLATNDLGTSVPSNLSVVTTYGSPVFNFVSNITSGFSPMPVQFTVNLFNYDLESWQWYFGDGNSSQDENPTDTYSSVTNSTFTVIAIASNSYGTVTEIKGNYITLGLAPTNLVVTSTTTNVFGFNLQWQDNSNNELGFQIFRQDGIGNGFNMITTVITGQTTYTDFGSDTTVGLNSTIAYIYELRAFTSDTVSSFTNAAGIYPTANFYAFPTSGFASAIDSTFTVNFMDESINAVSWYWMFGDGIGTSTAQNPGPYTYTSITSPTVYYVIESVNDLYGAASLDTMAIYAGLPPSNLNATAISTSQVNLTWVINDNNALGYNIQRQVNSGSFSYLTSVPAGDTSYLDNGLQPVTNYGYQVQAFTTETVSEFSNIATVETLSLAYPVAAFSAAPITGFSPLTVQFTDQSVNDAPTTSPSWLWNFGDGNGSGVQNPMHTYTSTTGANFTVILIVTNAYGTSTSVRSNLIHVGPLGNFGLLPDFKFNNNSAQSDVLNLNNYTTTNLTWNAFAEYNIAKPSVDTLNNVSFDAPAIGTAVSDTVNFNANNTSVTTTISVITTISYDSTTTFSSVTTLSFETNISSIVKYSTYLMQKVPSVTVDSGTFIDSPNIPITNYVTPSTDFWPIQPTVIPVTAVDNNEVKATIPIEFSISTGTTVFINRDTTFSPYTTISYDSTTMGYDTTISTETTVSNLTTLTFSTSYFQNTLTLSYNASNIKKLHQPVNVIVTASPDSTGTDEDQEIVRVYEVLNPFGRFTAASDTSAYGFEIAPNTPNGVPYITWLDTYPGATGVLRLTFTLESEGLKFTPYSQYYVPTMPNNWYTVRARVMCDAPTLDNTFSLTLFAYDGVPPAPTEVSGTIYFSAPTTWTWLECPIYTTGTSLYPQIIVKNFSTSLRNFYIDDIQVIQKKPDIALAYGETKVFVPTATFSVASDTTLYAFEPPPSGVISTTAFTIINDALDVTISGSTANGVKLTPIVSPGKTLTSAVTVGNGAGASCQVTTSGSLTNPVVLISIYGTSSANSQTINQLGAFADIFAVPSTGSNYTVTAAFSSLYPYFYPQITVRATGTGDFYINDFYPLVDSDLPYYWDYSLLQ
jgi:PKD repeat protein